MWKNWAKQTWPSCTGTITSWPSWRGRTSSSLVRIPSRKRMESIGKNMVSRDPAHRPQLPLMLGRRRALLSKMLLNEKCPSEHAELRYEDEAAMTKTRRLPIGAETQEDGVQFRVWAPRAHLVTAVLEESGVN